MALHAVNHPRRRYKIPSYSRSFFLYCSDFDFFWFEIIRVMESLKSASRSYTIEAASRFLKVGINPSTGPIRYITTREAGKRPRTTFQSD